MSNPQAKHIAAHIGDMVKDADYSNLKQCVETTIQQAPQEISSPLAIEVIEAVKVTGDNDAKLAIATAMLGIIESDVKLGFAESAYILNAIYDATDEQAIQFGNRLVEIYEAEMEKPAPV